MNHPTIRYLQEYLKSKDYRGHTPEPYFLKLVEEVGELSRAMVREAPPATEENFRGSIEEELWDILYYVLCLANEYDIDLEKWIQIKEEYNNRRYNPDAVYAPK